MKFFPQKPTLTTWKLVCKKAQTKTRNLFRKGYTLYLLIHNLSLNKPTTMGDIMLVRVAIRARRGETTHAFLKSGHIEWVRPLFSVSLSCATTKLRVTELRREPRGRGWAGLWRRGLRSLSLTSAGSWKCPRAAGAGVRETAQIIDALTSLECSVPDLKYKDWLQTEENNADKLEVSHNKQICDF